MRRLFVFLACLAATAPAAAAQDRCSIYKRFIAAGPEGFASLKQGKTNLGLDRSSIGMPGIGPCQIADEPGRSLLACFSSPLDPQTARARYASAIQFATECLAGWTTSRPESPSGSAEIIEGVRFIGVGANAGGEFIISLNKMKSSPIYALTGGLAWTHKAEPGA